MPKVVPEQPPWARPSWQRARPRLSSTSCTMQSCSLESVGTKTKLTIAFDGFLYDLCYHVCVYIYILYTYLQYVFTFFIVLNLALCLPSAKLASCFCRCSQPMLKPILSGCRNDSIKTKILKVVQEVYGGADVKYSDTW